MRPNFDNFHNLIFICYLHKKSIVISFQIKHYSIVR